MSVIISPIPIISPGPELVQHPLFKLLGIAAVYFAANVAGCQLHAHSDGRAPHQIHKATDLNMVEFRKIQTAILAMAYLYPKAELKDDLFKTVARGGLNDDPLAASIYVPPYLDK